MLPLALGLIRKGTKKKEEERPRTYRKEFPTLEEGPVPNWVCHKEGTILGRTGKTPLRGILEMPRKKSGGGL